MTSPISRRPLLVLIFWQENTHNQTLARPYFHSAARLLAVENKIVLGDFLSSKINLFSTVFSPEIKKKNSSKVITSNVPAGRIGHVVDAGRRKLDSTCPEVTKHALSCSAGQISKETKRPQSILIRQILFFLE
jgi:hypothetical protein